MLYPYEVIEVKPKLNKKKVFFAILIIIAIIALAIFYAFQLVEHKREQEIEKEKIEEQARIEERRQEEERLKEEQKKEEQLSKVTNPFTEEQMQAVENIYSSEEKRVFLTFDDGPTQAVTPYILDLLKQEDIKATFFVLGSRAKVNPELIQREFAEGHYIANHSYSHKYSQIYQNSQTVLDEYNTVWLF